jgi:hypothetical protein
MHPSKVVPLLTMLTLGTCVHVQFGKVDANTYIMDFNPTIVSAAQAFAVALSTFDTKVLL